MGRRKKRPIIYNGVELQDFETPLNFWCTPQLSTQELYDGGHIKDGESFIPLPKRTRRYSDSDNDDSRTGLSQTMTKTNLQEELRVSLANLSKSRENMESEFADVMNRVERKLDTEKKKSRKVLGESKQGGLGNVPNQPNNYTPMAFGSEILRGTVSQFTVAGGGGVQCAAVCASVAAHSLFKPVQVWDSNDLNNAVKFGVAYYSTKFDEDYGFLEAYEVAGQMECANGKIVKIEVNDSYDGDLHGLLNTHQEDDTANRLDDSVEAFLRSSHQFAILTTNSYSFLLIKELDELYFVDSHARGPEGQRSENGFACIIKVNPQDGSAFISSHVHSLCAPEEYYDGNPLNLRYYSYSIKPFTCKISERHNESDNELEADPTWDPVDEDETDYESDGNENPPWEIDACQNLNDALDSNSDSETDFDPEEAVGIAPYANQLLGSSNENQTGLRDISPESGVISGRLQCPFCPFNIQDDGVYQNHLRRHRNVKNFYCAIPGCKFSAPSYEAVQNHAITEHNVKLFPCTGCHNKLYTYTKLREHHLDQHTGKKRCSFCDAICKSRSVLRKHIANLHRSLIGLCEETPRKEKSSTELLKNPTIQESMENVINPSSQISLLVRSQFIVGYDLNESRPVYTFEHLYSSNLKAGEKKKRTAIFQRDPELPDNYITSEAINFLGYDNGHLAAARNHRNSKRNFEKSFYMTNICPMNKHLNVGMWSSLEHFVRKLAKHYSSVRVISGPIYDDYNHPKQVSIGCVKISVPSHFFKVIFMERPGEQKYAQAYVIPNGRSEASGSFFQYRTSIEEVENLTGLELVGKTGRTLSWNVCVDIPLYRCMVHTCNMTFTTQALLEAHKQVHEKEIRCPLCKKIMETKEMLETHMALSHLKKCIYEDCPYTTIYTTYLTDHVKGHLGQRDWKCDFPGCENVFLQKRVLDVHKRVHTGEKPYKCSWCNQEFAHEQSLRGHIRTHTGEKPYVCDVVGCGKSFTWGGTLIEHMRTHTGEKPFKCTYCGKGFPRRSQLNSHERTHTGEKPYQCSYCSQAFSSRKTCTIHERTHTGEKPYVCDVPGCGKAYSHLQRLNAHKRSHTGEKPYECSICNQRFTRSDTLAVHMQTHMEDRPMFVCQFEGCGKTYTRKDKLLKHQERNKHTTSNNDNN